jgi:hypothetical protein
MRNSKIEKMPALNVRFAASGGVARPTMCAEQHFLLSSELRLYRHLTASRFLVVCKQTAKFSGDFDLVDFDSFVKYSVDFDSLNLTTCKNIEI